MEKKPKSIRVAGIVILLYSLWILGSILVHILPVRILPYKVYRLLFVNTMSHYLRAFWYIALVIGLIYFISSINILRLKNWARLLAVYLSGVLGVIVAVIGLILGILMLDKTIMNLGDHPIVWGLILPTVIFRTFWPSLLFLFFLTRPKIKEQFKN